MQKYLLFFLLSFNTYALQLLEDSTNTTNNNNETSLQAIKNLAKSGDARSQFQLANMYYNGEKVEKDVKLSFYWYKQVANKNYPSAQFNVANSYYNGVGVDKNIEQAILWYEKAANLDLVPAIYNLAFIYETDKKELKKSFSLYEKAANFGHSTSQLIVAKKYQNGIGVEKNYTTANKWFKLAINNNTKGNDDAKYYFAEFLLDTNDINKALKFYQEAVKDGSILASYKLAQIYLQGKLIQRNTEKAIELLIQSVYSKYPHPPAQELLASIYRAEKKYKKAIFLYNKAADNGNAKAQYVLGVLYLKGIGVKKDIYKSTTFFIKAAQQNYLNAQYSLAIRYLKGEGIEKNYIEAVKWLRRAAKENHINAQYSLSVRYKLGQGVEKDEKQRIFWLKQAAKNSQAARYELAALTMLGENTGITKKDAVQTMQKLTKNKDFIGGANYHLGRFFIRTRPQIATQYLSVAVEHDNQFAIKLLQQQINKQKPVIIINDPIKKATILRKKIKNKQIAISKLILPIKEPLIEKNNNITPNNASKSSKIESMYNLAIMVLNKAKLNNDYKNAFNVMRRVADLGFPPAQNDLAIMYLNGTGTKINLQKSYEFAYLSLENSYMPAKKTITIIKNTLNAAN